MNALRHALRSLRRQPAFSAVVILTAALGIGATTAIFSLTDALLIRPFPYRDSERLVRLSTVARDTGNAIGASLADLEDWQAGQSVFEDIAAYITFDNNLTGDGPALSVRMTFASPQLFPILGIQPALGRTFTAEENVPGGDVRKVLISHELWQTRFGGDRGVLGRVVRLRGDSYSIVGVMPPSFRFPERSDVWVPLMSRYASYTAPVSGLAWWQRRDTRIHQVIGRLKNGVELPRAQAAMTALAARLEQTYGAETNGIEIRTATLRDAEVGNIRPYLLMLLTAGAMVLLISVVNIANILLARASSREREVAIHAALGSPRARLVLRLLTESLLLALAGGALGIVLAGVAIRSIVALLPANLPAWIDLRIDARVLAFSIAAALATGVLFGLVPAIRLTAVDLHRSLKDGAKGSSTGGQRLRDALLVAEVAMSMVLLTGAGLLLKSFLELQRTDPGFRTERLLTVRVARFISGPSGRELVNLYSAPYAQLAERFGRLPGVSAVGGSYNVPFQDKAAERRKEMVYVKGQDAKDRLNQISLEAADVTPGFFDALGMRMLDGRRFTEADDAQSPDVAIVSQSAAAMLWPGRMAVGQQLRLGIESPDNRWCRVVGVVSDTRWSALETQRAGEVYFSYRQWPMPAMTFFLRTSGAPGRLAAAARQVVGEVHPDLAVTGVRTLEEIAGESLWQQRLWGAILASFAALSLVLAAIGLYGVMSYLVTQRRREMGIRMALGAQPADVISLVLRKGLVLTGGGVVLGSLAARLLAGALSSQLSGVGDGGAALYAGVAAVLIATATAACLMPALRAGRTDPLIALRQD